MWTLVIQSKMSGWGRDYGDTSNMVRHPIKSNFYNLITICKNLRELLIHLENCFREWMKIGLIKTEGISVKYQVRAFMKKLLLWKCFKKSSELGCNLHHHLSSIKAEFILRETLYLRYLWVLWPKGSIGNVSKTPPQSLLEASLV